MIEGLVLDSEELIANSGIRDVFTPHTPINDAALFSGRSEEVAGIIAQINTPGQHSLLFGDRGVGKSSLARIASQLGAARKNMKVIVKNCVKADGFREIVAPLLRELEIDVSLISVEESDSKERNLNAGMNLIGASAARASGNLKKREGFAQKADSPAWVAEQVGAAEILFLIDEIDVIPYSEKEKVAELVKQLSDSNSSLKLLIVGIADTAVELTNGHPSVQRVLREIRLKKMSDVEVEALVLSGAKKANIRFEDSSVEKIVALSSGYPHFAHLLALKAAEIVISRRERVVLRRHIDEASDDAAGDADGSLRGMYGAVVRSAQTDAYKKILVAAAAVDADEIKAKSLRESMFKLWGEEVSQQWLNNFFKRIVGNDGTTILTRLGKGVYKFSDPRMKSYIRIVNFENFSGGNEQVEERLVE